MCTAISAQRVARNSLSLYVYLPDAAIRVAKSKFVQGIAVKLVTCSTLKGFSVMVLSPALSATIVSTHRFGRKTLRTLLMMDLMSEAFSGSVT